MRNVNHRQSIKHITRNFDIIQFKMSSDSYGERLDEIIRLFQDYKSGSVKLDNITKLCQTLGLESFIEDVESQVSRLSAASKIIVIDIDFAKDKGKVTDVKLVLASNFDNFNYYVDNGNGNILLNSLVQYDDLHEFHHNLKYLHLLDSFSNIDIDASNGSTSGNGTGVDAGGQGAYGGKMDLFKYHTELAQFIRYYFEANSSPFKVCTNLNNRFGIYILDHDGEFLAKIYLARAKDPRQRLYEFTYKKDSQDWINESAENYTCGVSLVMEILCDELSTWFPQDFIPDDLLQVNSGTAGDEQRTSAKFDLNELIQSSKNNAAFNTNFELVNDFNGKLINLRSFDISNDNLNLILEILNWLQWSQKVLQPVLNRLFGPSEIANETKQQDGQAIIGSARPRRSSASSGHKRRRFSGNRRPSITESTMLRDEGFQQFTLNEILTNSKPVTSQQSAESISDVASQDKMDVDHPVDESKHPIQLVVSEDHVSLADIAHCSLYDSSEKWKTFIDIIQKYTPK
ncbi:hypothetical protein HG537_0B02120 [Torulaspora globosa]|uniref:Mediator of RNA polymerase II transcription subunit 1 n=1 Tax=Torulaspora globosa TaxID=48254 RepID=A0A7H9HM50_9SACH|nr:hypothetical protein HG537_0B02120 [Torulaspora sp. CBS 2947]